MEEKSFKVAVKGKIIKHDRSKGWKDDSKGSLRILSLNPDIKN